jgi:hypothetical protein
LNCLLAVVFDVETLRRLVFSPPSASVWPHFEVFRPCAAFGVLMMKRHFAAAAVALAGVAALPAAASTVTLDYVGIERLRDAEPV